MNVSYFLYVNSYLVAAKGGRQLILQANQKNRGKAESEKKEKDGEEEEAGGREGERTEMINITSYRSHHY